LKNMLYGAQQRGNMPRPGKRSLFENAQVLKNKSHRTLVEGTECDPIADTVNLDIGIIQSGTVDLICTEVSTSTTPGVCISIGGEHGDGQDDTQVSYFAYLCERDPCDCSEFDLNAGTGTIACAYCIYIDDNSIKVEGALSFEEDAALFRSNCVTVTKPYEQSYCYNTTFNQEDRAASTCEITIGDEPCTSCDYADPVCTAFDCTNTVDHAQAGNICDDPILPIVNHIRDIRGDNFDMVRDAVCKETNSPSSSPSSTDASSSSSPISSPCAGYSRRAPIKYLAAFTLATMVVGYLIA
jgi:hypothetical protein